MLGKRSSPRDDAVRVMRVAVTALVLAAAVVTASARVASASVRTGAATGVAGTFATLTGTITPAGADEAYYFQYGRTAGYGYRTASQAVASGTTPLPVSAAVYTGLAPATKYHFRIVEAYQDQGRERKRAGADHTFRTLGCTKVATPGGSLQDFVDQLVPGDVGCLPAGTYGARGTSTLISASGTAAQPIQLMRYPGQARPKFLGHLELLGDYVTISGWLFAGPTGNEGYPACNYGSTIGEEELAWIDGSYDQIDHSELRKDLCHAAVFVGTKQGYPVPAGDRLLNDYIHDNGNFADPAQANVDHGIYLGESTDALIADNVIVHNVAYGIVTWPNVSGSLIIDNTVVDNGMDGIGIEGDGSSPLSSDNVVQDNISYGNGEYGIRSYGTLGPGNLVDHNVVYGNGDGPFYDPAGAFTFTGNILADPMFAGGPGPAAYRLQPGSPAIGAADAAEPQDYADAPRPQAGADIGAWETPHHG